MTPLAARSFASLLEQSTGQQLADGRRWRIDTALQPVMRAYDIANLDLLAARAAAPTAVDLRAAVVEALLNHETSFFRDAAMFAMLVREGLPTLAAGRATRRRLRIWSAGCSTGQEVHSLALAIAAQGDAWRDWTIDIVGTDVSAAAVAKARDGLYTQFEVQRGLPIGDLIARFDQQDEAWRIRPVPPARVTFAVHNLLDPPPAGRFDVVLCRNVLFYFSADRRRQVFARLADAIAPDGLLVLGAGETVLDQTDAFQPDATLRSIYRPGAGGVAAAA